MLLLFQVIIFSFCDHTNGDIVAPMNQAFDNGSL